MTNTSQPIAVEQLPTVPQQVMERFDFQHMATTQGTIINAIFQLIEQTSVGRRLNTRHRIAIANYLREHYTLVLEEQELEGT
jgi:hypothetical protein